MSYKVCQLMVAIEMSYDTVVLKKDSYEVCLMMVANEIREKE